MQNSMWDYHYLGRVEVGCRSPDVSEKNKRRDWLQARSDQINLQTKFLLTSAGHTVKSIAYSGK